MSIRRQSIKEWNKSTSFDGTATSDIKKFGNENESNRNSLGDPNDDNISTYVALGFNFLWDDSEYTSSKYPIQ